MALLKTDASVDPKSLRTGATTVQNKRAQKLDTLLRGPDGKYYDNKRVKWVRKLVEKDKKKKMKWVKGPVNEGRPPGIEEGDEDVHDEEEWDPNSNDADTLLFDNDSDDDGDDATPFEYPEVVEDSSASSEEPKMVIGPDGVMYNPQDGFWENNRYHVRIDEDRTPPARPERPSSAPESSNARRHMHVGPDGQLYDDREWYWNNGRKYRVYSDRDPPRGSLPQRDPRSRTNRPRNGNTRPQTNRPRNRNTHKSGRFAENKTFDKIKQYIPDVKSEIYDFNGRPILAPVNKIIFGPEGEIELKRFDQRDLSRLVQRQIAMYLHDKNVAQKNAYVQKQLVGRYERRLRYVRPHLSKFRS
jgi:hypothetical protein